MYLHLEVKINLTTWVSLSEKTFAFCILTEEPLFVQKRRETALSKTMSTSENENS